MKKVDEEMRRRMQFFDWLTEREPDFTMLDEKSREIISGMFIRGECVVLRKTPDGGIVYRAKPKQNDASNGDKTPPA